MEENVSEKSTSDGETEITVEPNPSKSKEHKSGIIYLSRIPTGMNASIIRQYFNRFGETGRVFLQQHQHGNAAKRMKKRRLFSEGWIEFHKKKIAKQVAASLNNAQIGGKKKNPWREELWNIKYLPRFKWSHLHERLVYERAVHGQRLRAEINQAKREANFYIENAERNAKIKRKAKKQLKNEAALEKTGDSSVNDSSVKKSVNKSERVYEFRQKETEEEILGSKRKHGEQDSAGGVMRKKKNKKAKTDTAAAQSESRKSFLTRIFSGGVEADGV